VDLLLNVLAGFRFQPVAFVGWFGLVWCEAVLGWMVTARNKQKRNEELSDIKLPASSLDII